MSEKYSYELEQEIEDLSARLAAITAERNAEIVTLRAHLSAAETDLTQAIAARDRAEMRALTLETFLAAEVLPRYAEMIEITGLGESVVLEAARVMLGKEQV
jgi:hypothetical protein